MGNYDILRDTWIYQDIQQEIRREEQQQRLGEQRQLLLEIVRARFPRIVAQVERVVTTVSEPVALRNLLVKISSARTEKEARQAIQSPP